MLKNHYYLKIEKKNNINLKIFKNQVYPKVEKNNYHKLNSQLLSKTDKNQFYSKIEKKKTILIENAAIKSVFIFFFNSFSRRLRVEEWRSF